MPSLEKRSPRLSEVFDSGCVPWEEAWPGGGVDAFTLTRWCPGGSRDPARAESPPIHSHLWNPVRALLRSLHWGEFRVSSSLLFISMAHEEYVQQFGPWFLTS